MWYSRTKQDYYKRLSFRYSKHNMTERTLYTSADCYKCKAIKPYVEKYAQEHGIKFQTLEIARPSEITSVPTLVINGEDKQVLGYDDILALITNKGQN